MEFKDLQIKELLRLQSSITDELIERKIVRTRNSPLGDYTEWLVARALGLELQDNSQADYDGEDRNGMRVQIKGRQITTGNKSRRLSAIRKLNEKGFDALAAVIYDKNFNVVDALLIPHEVVVEYASFSKHVNGHILTINESIMSESRIKCIKQAVQKNERE